MLNLRKKDLENFILEIIKTAEKGCSCEELLRCSDEKAKKLRQLHEAGELTIIDSTERMGLAKAIYDSVFELRRKMRVALGNDPDGDNPASWLYYVEQPPK